MLNIILDGDACPDIKEVFEFAKTKDMKVTVFHDYCHELHLPKGIEQITVDSHADSADYQIFNKATKESIVITQDTKLAAMLLSKGCFVMNQWGQKFVDDWNRLDVSKLEKVYFNHTTRKTFNGLKKQPKRNQFVKDSFMKALDEAYIEHKKRLSVNA